MRRHLNTLYATTENAWLRKEGENVVVKVEGTQVGRVPIHLLGGIVCFGALGVTPQLMGHCAENAVSLCFLSRNGRFLARIEGPVSGNVKLRRSQYRWSDDVGLSTKLARDAVVGKLLNQRTVVRRAARDHRKNMTLAASDRLKVCERKLTNAARRASNEDAKNALRGIEGESARVYYSVFDDLIRSTDARFSFESRSRRPPLNPVNAMLSPCKTRLARLSWSLIRNERNENSRTRFLKEKTTLGLVPFVQARLLARRLRGELDGYPPFVWK